MDMMFLAHLSTKHPWVKSILVYFNEGPNIFPRGDNYKIENHWANFNQTLQKASLCKEEKPHLFTLGDNNKIAKVHSLKIY